ncbi:hypothetical protein F66182_8235 [Fusarium sp. NRRL 66182]|nr:hypothetical protein F66182_8235 [Fusarium sp. NRRL 66182]
MSFATLEDALKPKDDTFKAFYEHGYRTWHKLWAGAAQNCTLPPTCLEWEHCFPQHPCFPVGLDPDSSGVVTAKSSWSSSEGDCDIPAFEQTFQVPVTTGKPTSTILTEDLDLSLFEWFGKRDGHLVVLMFAWAYALSARWAELIPRASPMEYTTSQASWATQTAFDESNGNGGSMIVELGKPTEEAARWWAAVLAPGEGWKVSIPHERCRLLSPWSVTKDFNNISIVLAGPLGYMSSDPTSAASFDTALRYINEYSQLHNASTQSRAALAAALLLPLAKLDNREILLYAPRGLCVQPESIKMPGCSLLEQHSLCQLDRLLTLSTNMRGVKAVLGSIFYEPGIPANACGAWLQGTMAVLQSKGTKSLHHLARMFFDRSPHISFLWLGAIITGAHKDFLRATYGLLGLNRVDLHAGAWTGTLLSFIQEPVSPVHHDAASISRADECRLMFLTREPPRDFPPMYPYPPLGVTDIRDTDLGVQLHAHCPAKHSLRFLSIAWNCVEGKKDIQTTGPISAVSKDYMIDKSEDEDGGPEVDYLWLNRERDLSEGVTSHLFIWMRDMDGFTVAERDIYNHEWVELFDSDDESIHPEGDGRSTTGPIDAQVGSWMTAALTARCHSI